MRCGARRSLRAALVACATMMLVVAIVAWGTLHAAVLGDRRNTAPPAAVLSIPRGSAPTLRFAEMLPDSAAPPSMCPNTRGRLGVGPCPIDTLAVSVMSGEHAEPLFKPVSVCVRGSVTVDYDSRERGMHVIAIAPDSVLRDIRGDSDTGARVQRRVFDTYRWPGTDLAAHLAGLPLGTLVIVATHDDAQYSLGAEGEAALTQLGSQRVAELNFRGTFVLVAHVGGGVPLGEVLERAPHHVEWAWGARARLAICAARHPSLQRGSSRAPMHGPTNAQPSDQRAVFPAAVDTGVDGMAAVLVERQRAFCALPGRAAQFAPLCATSADRLLPPRGSGALAATFPVAVMASAHRPARLAALLLTLARQPGLRFSAVTVYIDGKSTESLPRLVAQVFGARVVEFPKATSSSSMAKTFQNADVIAIHYFRSLSDIWSTAVSPAVIVLEEDLLVSSDFLDYFSQTAPVLLRDPTLLAVSAWNDNGYPHASNDAAQLLRTQFFPGLGWLLTRTLWDELGPKWPACCSGWSWDLWLRLKSQTKGRDCIIPEVSRTFHAGSDGLNVDRYFFDAYFATRRLFNTSTHVVLRNLEALTRDLYDAELTLAVTRAVDVTARLAKAVGVASCTRGSLARASAAWDARPPAGGVARLVFYHQAHATDQATLLRVCTCLGVWDLGEVRGQYHGVLLLRVHGAPLLLVGSASPYAATHDPPPSVLLQLHTS